MFTAKAVDTDSGIFGQSQDVDHVFELSSVHKGSMARTQVVNSAGDPAACGLSIQSGERYIVFASLQGDVLAANSCGYTSRRRAA